MTRLDWKPVVVVVVVAGVVGVGIGERCMKRAPINIDVMAEGAGSRPETPMSAASPTRRAKQQQQQQQQVQTTMEMRTAAGFDESPFGTGIVLGSSSVLYRYGGARGGAWRRGGRVAAAPSAATGGDAAALRLRAAAARADPRAHAAPSPPSPASAGTSCA